jgi:hypothetical protein
MYRAYYDNIVENKSLQMEFFNERGNSEHAEHTCGILGTLATIYWQQGVLEDCEEVMDLEVLVMEKHKRSCQGGRVAQINCLDGLEYKMHCIRFNLCFQEKRYNECVPPLFWRRMMEYEIK